MEERVLDEERARDVSHGRAVSGDADGPVMLVANDRLIAIGYPRGDGWLQPKVVVA